VSLQRFQLDVAARIEASAFFANVPVFVFRPRSAQTAAQIQDQINASLGALTTLNGRAGLCATVLMPLLNIEKQELPGPYLHLKCTVRVQENVMINMGAAGTQIPCEDAALAVAQLLHLWTPGGTAGIVHAAPETITPNGSFQGKVTYDVHVESDLDLPCLPRTEQPFITNSAGTISISCSDPGAGIYYTTDGAAPWAGNGTYPTSATLYTAPFAAPPPGTLLRAASFNPTSPGSDIAWLQL